MTLNIVESAPNASMNRTVFMTSDPLLCMASENIDVYLPARAVCAGVLIAVKVGYGKPFKRKIQFVIRLRQALPLWGISGLIARRRPAVGEIVCLSFAISSPLFAA